MSRTAAWCRVASEELGTSVSPREFLRNKLAQAGIGGDAVGMLTSADLDGYIDIEKSSSGFSARVIATVGMTNALRVGDLPSREIHAGTINLLCAVSARMTKEALIEAVSIAAEARTAAVLESGILSGETGLPATGTGTDCIVLAAPVAPLEAEPIEYAGKHTLAGSLIGQSVFEAIRAGTESWRIKNQNDSVF